MEQIPDESYSIINLVQKIWLIAHSRSTPWADLSRAGNHIIHHVELYSHSLSHTRISSQYLNACHIMQGWFKVGAQPMRDGVTL